MSFTSHKWPTISESPPNLFSPFLSLSISPSIWTIIFSFLDFYYFSCSFYLILERILFKSWNRSLFSVCFCLYNYSSSILGYLWLLFSDFVSLFFRAVILFVSLSIFCFCSLYSDQYYWILLWLRSNSYCTILFLIQLYATLCSIKFTSFSSFLFQSAKFYIYFPQYSQKFTIS